MNFLLHRHFAREETGSDAIAFGAMLPDLVRLVDRRWRPQPPATSTGAGTAGDLRLGIAHHLDADVWFHRTEVFRAGEKRTAAALRATGDAAPRLGLFGHVTWEMCLDGAWLRRSDVARALEALRADVARYAEASGAALREAMNVENVSDARLSALWSRVPDLAAGYAHGEGVARRLDGIRRALGMPAASDAVRAAWSEVLEGCLLDAEACLDALSDERRSAISDPEARRDA